MNSLVKKNLFYRKSFDFIEKKKRIFRYLLSNNKIFLHIRWQCFLNIVKMNLTTSITKVKNFCFTTGKTKIFSRKFRISRFFLRKLLSKGKILDLY